MDSKTCSRHLWLYPHKIIDGKKKGWMATVRYCGDCGIRQVCHIPPTQWESAKGDYKRDEHFDG